MMREIKIAETLDQCLALAQRRENTSVGCGVVPYETNPETVIRVREYVENALVGH